MKNGVEGLKVTLLCGVAPASACEFCIVGVHGGGGAAAACPDDDSSVGGEHGVEG